MASLIIVESPAKCKKIESFLGAGYKCVASFGHIRQLDKVDAEFKPSFKLLTGKAKYIKPLRAAVKRAKEVILATDDDREGEAIAWHLCKYFRLPVQTTKRIIFHEITKPALLHAIGHPTHIDMDKVYAQQARQILDRLIGFTISPLLWKQFYHTGSKKSGLSAGRCQTPALRLVYDNQIEIDQCPGDAIYETTGNFGGINIPLVLNYGHKTDAVEDESVISFLQDSVKFQHTLLPPKAPVMRSKKAPLPFTTSTLQQKASNILHFSPKRTMKLAQTLYENGHITYMRTDSKKYSKEFIREASSFIMKNWGVQEDYLHKNPASISVGSAKRKNAQEAHEAVRPTKISKRAGDLQIGASEKRLYDLIWQNTVESCMRAARISHIDIAVTAPRQHLYKCNAEQIMFPGWLIVGGYEKKNATYNQFLRVKEKRIVAYVKIHSKFTMKKLKTHYTEARLVQMLERKGIGRPSTFSSLIDKIQSRSYVAKADIEGTTVDCLDHWLAGSKLVTTKVSRCFGKERNKLVIQPLGKMVIEFLLRNLAPLFAYEYTKKMECSLDIISKGAGEGTALCKSCSDEMHNLLKGITETNQHIRIDEDHIYMVGRYGPVIKYENNGNVQFKKVKSNIDIEKLRNGGYELGQILAEESGFIARRLGSFKNKDVILKKGRYGLYISCDGKNYSAKSCKKSGDRIKLEDVLDILLEKKSPNSKVLLTVNDNMSVRSGKYGPYVFYKTATMKKPRFLSLKGLSWKEYTASGLLSWIKAEYSL